MGAEGCLSPRKICIQNEKQDVSCGFTFIAYLCVCAVCLCRVIGTAEVPILIVGNKRDLQRGRVIPRHNVSDLVRKTWKCGYVECSAKFNWHVLLLFGEALRSVGCARCKHVNATIRFQHALRRERCALM